MKKTPMKKTTESNDRVVEIQSTPETSAPKGPLDPSRLRLSQNYAEKIGVKKALLTVPTRKPDKQWFVRVHPDPAWRLETAVIELKEEREVYLVEPDLWSELPGELVPKILLTTINRQGVLFLWPIRLPGGDGKHDEWNRSALAAAELATKTWVRVASNLSLGAYESFVASGNLPQPEWPNVTFDEVLNVAFKDRFIRSTDHPVVQKLMGRV